MSRIPLYVCTALFIVAGCGGSPVDTAGSATEAATTTAPGYTWPLPAQGWFRDDYDFPLVFAPALPYRGHEELHQLDGFGTPTSPEFWSYAFLWWVEGHVRVTRRSLESDLTTYYKGLCDAFGAPDIACDPQAFAARVTPLGRLPLGGRAVDLFGADVDAIDPFFTGKPLALHFLIAAAACPRAQHTALLFTASTQPYGAAPWSGLVDQALQFKCE